MYVLHPGQTVELPAQLLVVRVQAPRDHPAPRIEARPSDPGSFKAAGAPGLVALSVAERTTISIQPTDGAGPFDTGSVFTLNIQTEGEHASAVTLQGIDASGLHQRDLVTLEPRGEAVAVTAISDARDLHLPPIADAARTSARRHLQSHRLRAPDLVGLAVIVDASASMRSFAFDGELKEALELILGLGQVVSGPDAPATSTVSRSLRHLTTDSLQTWPADVTRATVQQQPAVGFRSRVIPQMEGRSLTLVVTDDVPADLDHDRRDLHLVLLGANAEETASYGAVAVTPLPTRPGSTLSGDEVQVGVTSIIAHLPPPTRMP